MRNLLLVIVFLFNSSFIVGQIFSCGHINSVTFSPVAGTNDITANINSYCCDVHGLDGYVYTNNAPNHTLRLCYRDSGLTLQTTITANIVLSNANTATGTQNFTINSYFYFGGPSGDSCSSNTVFNSLIALSFDTPLLQPRVFTLANNEFETRKLSIYPNPNNGAFSIDLPTNMNKVQLTIFDVSGKEVNTNFSYSSGDLITLENLSSGLYFAKVLSGESTETLKFVIN